MVLFPQGKRTPPRRRGAKLNERKEPRRPAGAVRNAFQRRKKKKAVAARRAADSIEGRRTAAARTLFSIEAYTVNDQESDNLWLTLIENY